MWGPEADRSAMTVPASLAVITSSCQSQRKAPNFARRRTASVSPARRSCWSCHPERDPEVGRRATAPPRRGRSSSPVNQTRDNVSAPAVAIPTRCDERDVRDGCRNLRAYGEEQLKAQLRLRGYLWALLDLHPNYVDQRNDRVKSDTSQSRHQSYLHRLILDPCPPKANREEQQPVDRKTC